MDNKLLVICPIEVTRIAIRIFFKKLGWHVTVAASIPDGMTIYPEGFNMVILDENHGCKSGSIETVISAIYEMRIINNQIVVLAIATRGKGEASKNWRRLQECADKLVRRTNCASTLFVASCNYFKYTVL
ncbi:MAG: hypothetical protein V1838_03310 [Patescibacteria group bacterium]